MGSHQYKLWIGSTCLLVAGCVLWSVLVGDLGDPTNIASPAFFPLLAGMLIAGVSVWLIAEAVIGMQTFSITVPRLSPPSLTGTMLLFLGYALAVPWVGMLFASSLAVPVLAWLFGQRRWWVLALLAALPSWLVIRVFESALNVLFPQWGLPWSI